MKAILLLIAILFSPVASAQLATASAWAINGTVLISGKDGHVFDHLVSVKRSDIAPFDVDEPSLGFSSEFFNWGEVHSSVGWNGHDESNSALDVAASSRFRDWELRIDSRQNTLLDFKIPYLGAYANIKGFCENRLEAFSAIDIHGATLTINGIDILLPATPEENQIVSLDTETSQGQIEFRKVTLVGVHGVEMIGIDMQVRVSKEDVSAIVDLQLVHNAASLDCQGLPVELQTWEVE